MAIRLNFHLGTKASEDGTLRPFGKIGYQVMSPKLDKFTAKNLADIERALLAGELQDLEGNPVTNHGVIDVYCTVSLVADDDTMESVSSIRNSAGGTAAIPAAKPAEDADGDDPF